MMQAGAETDDAIALGDHVIGRRRGERTEDVHVVGMAVEQPLGLERGGQRRLQPVGQPDQLVAGAGRAAPGQDDRAPGRGDHADRVVDRIALGHIGRRIESLEHHLFVFDLLPHEIGGHVHDDGPFLHAGAVEGMGDIIGRGFRRADLFEPGAGHLDRFPLIDVLQVLRGHLRRVAGEQDHRDMAARALGQSGDAIGQGRPMGNGRHAHLPRDVRIRQRHQYRAALEGDRHKGALVGSNVVIDHEEIRIAHQAEHRVDAMILYGACNRLISVGFRVGHGLRHLIGSSELRVARPGFASPSRPAGLTAPGTHLKAARSCSHYAT